MEEQDGCFAGIELAEVGPVKQRNVGRLECNVRHGRRRGRCRGRRVRVRGSVMREVMVVKDKESGGGEKS